MKRYRWLIAFAACLLLITSCTRSPGVQDPVTESSTAATEEQTEPETK